MNTIAETCGFKHGIERVYRFIMLSTMIQTVSLFLSLSNATVCTVDRVEDNGVAVVSCDSDISFDVAGVLVGNEGEIVKGESALRPCGVQVDRLDASDITL